MPQFFVLFIGEHVAQFKFTVLLMPNGPHKITGLPFEEELFSSEHSVKDADIQVLEILNPQYLKLDIFSYKNPNFFFFFLFFTETVENFG